MNKFKNKFRIPSARARWWDYSRNAVYYVTICTKNRRHYFGYVKKGIGIPPRLVLTRHGEIARQCWLDIPLHFPFVQLDEFAIMPNHIHGILIIRKPKNDAIKPAGNGGGRNDVIPLSKTTGPAQNKFGPQSQNLGSIIRGFKVGVTKNVRIFEPGFQWQSLYHDRVIRDLNEWERIAKYIRENPDKWLQREK